MIEEWKIKVFSGGPCTGPLGSLLGLLLDGDLGLLGLGGRLLGGLLSRGLLGLLVLSGLHVGCGHDGLGLALSCGEDLGLADLDSLDGDDDAAGPSQLLGEVSGDDVLDDLGEGPLLSDGDEGLSDDPLTLLMASSWEDWMRLSAMDMVLSL